MYRATVNCQPSFCGGDLQRGNKTKDITTTKTCETLFKCVFNWNADSHKPAKKQKALKKQWNLNHFTPRTWQTHSEKYHDEIPLKTKHNTLRKKHQKLQHLIWYKLYHWHTIWHTTTVSNNTILPLPLDHKSHTHSWKRRRCCLEKIQKGSMSQTGPGCHFGRSKTILFLWTSNFKYEETNGKSQENAWKTSRKTALLLEKLNKCWMSQTGPRKRLSLIHIWRCRRSYACRSRWSPYH